MSIDSFERLHPFHTHLMISQQQFSTFESALAKGLFICFCFLIFTIPAFAHPVAQGSIILEPTSEGLHFTMRASLEQITVERGYNQKDTENLSLEDQWIAHANYILTRTRVTEEGVELSGSLVKSVKPHRDKSFVVFDFIFPHEKTANIKRITVTENILNEFDFAPGNPWEATYVVSIVGQGQPRTAPQLLTPRQTLNVTFGSGESASAVSGNFALFSQFLVHGIQHIFGGFDHLLFAAALVIGVRAFWDVVRVIASFTLAHTTTLALAALNIIRVPTSVVEPLIGLSIVVVAVLNFGPRRETTMRRTLALAFFFGLFHGLGFAGGLIDAMANLPSSHFWTALCGFSIGVEIGHQAIVIPLFVLLAAARNYDAIGAMKISKVLTNGLNFLISIGGIFFLVKALGF